MKADVRLMLTADGSHTAVSQQYNKPYHSIHGAVQESQRVFIELGLLAAFEKFPTGPLRVFEMGLGTGLNVLLTAREAALRQHPVQYTALEAFPMALDDAQLLNYDEQLGTNYLNALHTAPWNEPVALNPYFTVIKQTGNVLNLDVDADFQLVYYDAFAPSAQPELWEPDTFAKMARLLVPGGMLTTYCSKSYVQRNLRTAGFRVEKHPGPYGKREVLRAIR